MEDKRVIFHIDVNSAFLSWTAVQMLNQGHRVDIRRIPSVVSGDPNDRRSIVTAKSIPAKSFDIHTGEPVTMALRKCPMLRVVHGDWEWYKKCSRDFIGICRTYSPVLQQFSIDECFLDMTGKVADRTDAVEQANRLREEIRTTLGFTVNIGVGSNKLLAKMASDFEKPNKVHTLWDNEVEAKMWHLDVGDLLWVGRKSAEKLRTCGIKTIGQLSQTPMTTLTYLFGKKFARQMHENANGRDDSPVDTEVAEAKSYSAERTFAYDIYKAEDLDRELFKVACIVAHRIRRESFCAYGVSVFVKTKDFISHSKQRTMERPTDVTAIILNEARRLVSEIWDGVTPLRQVGLGVFHLTHDAAWQMTLFDDYNKIEYYRQWDQEYDERRKSEDKKDKYYK